VRARSNGTNIVGEFSVDNGTNWVKILDTSKNFVSQAGGETYKASARIKAQSFSVIVLRQSLKQ